MAKQTENGTLLLTDKLIEGLIRKYQEKGINVQRLLDNQEFKNLPLDKKVQVLENYKNQLSQVPSFNYKSPIIAAGLGGLGSILGTAAMGVGLPVPTSSYAIMGGIGAAVAGIMATLAEREQFNRDMVSRNHIYTNKYLDAIINTSESRPLPVKPDVSLVTKPVTDMTNNLLIGHARQIAYDRAMRAAQAAQQQGI